MPSSFSALRHVRDKPGPWAAPQKLDYWINAPTRSFPRENSRNCGYSPIHSMLNGGLGLWKVSMCQFKPSLFFLSGPWLGALFCQHLDSGKAETSPSGSPLKDLNISCMLPSSLSLSREKTGVGSFPPITMLCWWDGLWWVGDTDFSTSFNVADFMVAWMQELFNWFPGFF